MAVIANNGMSMCFGATIMLEGTFPTYIPLSKQLDLLDDYENRVAYAYLFKAKEHGERFAKLQYNDRRLIKEMELDLDKYYIKSYTNDVYARGLGLFADNSNNRFEISVGLSHMITCLNRLYDSPARDVPEYPLSIRTPDSYSEAFHSQDYFEFIFRDLCALGYVSGTPNRIDNPDLYEAFRVELRRVMALVHDAGIT